MEETAKTVNKQSEGEIIAQTSIRALGAFLVIFALLFTLWTALFPLTASDFYDEMGNLPRAYECAKTAVKTSSGADRTNAKIKCVNYAISLYSQNPSAYADCLIADTADFLLDSDCGARAKKIDDYNIASTPKSFHPAIYGYLDYIRSTNCKARVKLNGDDRVWVADQLVSLASALNSPSVSVAQQLVAILSVKDLSGYDATANITFVNALAQQLAQTYEPAYLSAGKKPSLEFLYGTYACVKVKSVLIDKELAQESNFNNVAFDGESLALNDLYDKLTEKY